MNTGTPSVKPPAVPPAPGWPIRFSIASVVVLAMLVLAAAVLALGSYGSRQNAIATATQTARDAGKLVTEQARRMLEPAQSTVRQLGFDPIATATTLDERLQRIYVLSEELAVNELVSAIYVGYDNGDFVLARPLDRPEVRRRFEAPPMANFLVQSVTQQADGSRRGEYRFFTANGKEIERRPQADYRFDPRTRPWYQVGIQSGAAELSPPYVFFTTQQVGITLSQRSRSGRSVIGIDVVLDDLASSLGDLRVTPRTQLALVNAQHEVLAYPDMSRVLKQGNNSFNFKTLQELDEPSLTPLNELLSSDQPATLYHAQGEEWLGVALNFDVWRSPGMRLLVAMPSSELMGELERRRMQVIALVIVVVLLLLPVGWWAGAGIGRSLDSLSRRAHRIGRFDFARPSQKRPSWVREVNQLSTAMDGMGRTIETFLRISETMATEPQVERMLGAVLQQFLAATRCDGAAVYLWNESAGQMNRAVAEGQLPASLVGRFAFDAQRTVRTGTRRVDSGEHQMELELRGRTGQLQGLLVLNHQGDDDHADAAFIAFAKRLSGMLAVSIETRQLIDAQKNLLDAVIRLMADAIDAKSPYTGGHCERVPQLATLLADRMHADRDGPYAGFAMSEDERYAFYLAAWLHDCGKVTSPEHIVDKATKLEVIYNRIHELRLRFELLWRDADIAHLRRVAAGADSTTSEAERDARHAQLRDDFAFVAQCNVGGEFMADAAIERLRTIATQTWQRHFDHRLGLSSEELKRLLAAEPEAPALPATEPLLADRPEHVVPWANDRPPVEKDHPDNRYGFDMVLPAHKQNMGEVYNLSIRRGTLTDEDRFKINDHIVQTYIMLKGLPWPRQLARVPEIAANHHEKMDGKGYPRRLPADQLSTADRVMALADIFEALTAADRPYKAPKTLSESLKIMAFMCKDQHLDTELFRYFLHSGVWREFAQRFMLPAQVDEVDVAGIEKLLPAPV
jgi:HD-GYP domain-containing protein (c-di-GMP phosphodiesterase class II)